MAGFEDIENRAFVMTLLHGAPYSICFKATGKGCSENPNDIGQLVDAAKDCLGAMTDERQALPGPQNAIKFHTVYEALAHDGRIAVDLSKPLKKSLCILRQDTVMKYRAMLAAASLPSQFTLDPEHAEENLETMLVLSAGRRAYERMKSEDDFTRIGAKVDLISSLNGINHSRAYGQYTELVQILGEAKRAQVARFVVIKMQELNKGRVLDADRIDSSFSEAMNQIWNRLTAK